MHKNEKNSYVKISYNQIQFICHQYCLTISHNLYKKRHLIFPSVSKIIMKEKNLLTRLLRRWFHFFVCIKSNVDQILSQAPEEET